MTAPEHAERMYAYAHFCGPRALAALSDLDPAAAAFVLDAVARVDGWEPDGRTTRAGDLGRAFLARGFDLDLWPGTPARGPDLTAAEFRAALLRAGHREPGAGAGPLAVASSTEHGGRTRRRLRAVEFVWRHPTGAWLIHLEDHVLAARDGRILAGEQDSRGRSFLGRPVEFAHHVSRSR